MHYENGDTLNLLDTRKGTFFFFNTPLFSQRELKALQTKQKDKSPQEPGTFVFLEMSGIQATSKGISAFQ